jgi:hypothetical protein
LFRRSERVKISVPLLLLFIFDGNRSDPFPYPLLFSGSNEYVTELEIGGVRVIVLSGADK